MKSRTLAATAASVAVAALALVATRSAWSGDDAPKDAPPGMPTAEEMQAMLELAAPNEEHAELAKLVGTWDCEMSMDMGGQEMKSSGSMTTESILGGRVFLSRFQGDFGGMPFEGVELKGYDKAKKEHWSVWCDSMGTGFLAFHGRRGKDGTVASASDAYNCPVNGPCTMTITSKLVDADHVDAVMTMITAGKPASVSKMRYTRRAAAAPAAAPETK